MAMLGLLFLALQETRVGLRRRKSYVPSFQCAGFFSLVVSGNNQVILAPKVADFEKEAIVDFRFSRSRVRPGTLPAYSAPLSCLRDSTLRVLRTQETEVSPRVLGLAVDVGVSLEQN